MGGMLPMFCWYWLPYGFAMMEGVAAAPILQRGGGSRAGGSGLARNGGVVPALYVVVMDGGDRERRVARVLGLRFRCATRGAGLRAGETVMAMEGGGEVESSWRGTRQSEERALEA
jgi:hypothetical protein